MGAANWLETYRRTDRLERCHQREIVAWLAPAPGARVLDAGCGAGGLATVLADAVGPDGGVTAVDTDPEALRVAADVVAEHGMAATVTLVEADVQDTFGGALPGAPFDLVLARWMVHHLPDQLAGVRALAGFTRRREAFGSADGLTGEARSADHQQRPGGRLALGEGGLPTRTLPTDVGVGEPGLEARLDVANGRWFAAHVRAALPHAVPWTRGWPALLEAAGLVEVTTRTFLFEAQAPPGSDAHALVRGRLVRMTDPEHAAFVAPDDLATLRRLLDPDDPASIDRRDDLHLLHATSIHVGTVPADA